MKYMLLVYGDEQALDDIEKEQCYLESAQLAHELHSAGQYLAADPLHPTSRAVSVRVRESKRLVTDGPFAEAREQLGGYFLIEANDGGHRRPDPDGTPGHRRGPAGHRATGSADGVASAVTVPDEAEAERLFASLGSGGQVQMLLSQTFFSPRFGMVADRFGVSWMIYVAP